MRKVDEVLLIGLRRRKCEIAPEAVGRHFGANGAAQNEQAPVASMLLLIVSASRKVGMVMLTTM
jgi:hypothetical protein